MLDAGPVCVFLFLFFPFLLCFIIGALLLHLQHGVYGVDSHMCYGCQDACITELAHGGHILL
jgi:hypothetical protein